MYGKVFTSIFEGSLHGQFEALVVMQALIVLADKDGIVDKTPEAIAAFTSYPLDFVRKGLAQLAQPDPRSRSKELGGRRIVLIDPERDWGWMLVNHAKYRSIRNDEERRVYMRDYMANRRVAAKAVSSSVNTPLTELANAASDATSDAHAKKKTHSASPREKESNEFLEFWELYPRREGGNPRPDALKAWNARVREGVSPADLLDGAKRYARQVKTSGKEGSQFVMQAENIPRNWRSLGRGLRGQGDGWRSFAL